MTIKSVLGAVALVLSLPTIAAAQDTDPGPALPEPDQVGKGFTIGGGIGITPDYTGSDDYRIIPAVAFRGNYKGISFSSSGTYVSADVLPAKFGKLELDAGPVAGVRLNRVKTPKDPVVALLPTRKAAIELGGYAGVSLKGLTNPYDSLSAKVEILHDVNGAHGSTVVSPSLSFGTPLSLKSYVSLSASADYVQQAYADTYFAITPADSLASGLPVFAAKKGMQGYKVNLLANRSISGNLLGGWSIFGLGSYGRLSRDFADSPIVSLRGSRTQWMGAAGLAYTF